MSQSPNLSPSSDDVVFPQKMDTADLTLNSTHGGWTNSRTALVRFRYLESLGWILLWSMVFGISFTQWPLYSENQNTKYLIGLAAAGMGVLEGDWLANTVDPLPAFTALVHVTYRFLDQNLFYAYHALLLGIYLYSLIGIGDKVFRLGKSRAGQLIFAAFVIAFHATLLWPFSMPMMGTSLGWIVQAGVANQYLLNPVLQPSTFGVLLIFSIFLFLHERPYWAAAMAATAAVFHSTYLPAAAFLTIAYVLLTMWETRQLAKPLGIGGTALLVVLPILLYNFFWLGPTSAENWQRAQDLIVNFRIPHHSIPEIWLDQTSTVKLAIVAIGTLLAIRSRLFIIMLIPFIAAVFLTWLQMRIDNDTLAFIAPWRISVFLVPLSTAMIGAFFFGLLFNHWPQSWTRSRRGLQWGVSIVAIIWMILLVGKGTTAIQDSFAARSNHNTAALWQFGWDTKQPGQVYLVPTYMAEFRLETGIPVVITFKSHPYKDVEVIAWRERIDAVNHFYANISCDQVSNMVQRYGVTHVVLERVQFFDGCPIIHNIHVDERFGVFEVVGVQ